MTANFAFLAAFDLGEMRLVHVVACVHLHKVCQGKRRRSCARKPFLAFLTLEPLWFSHNDI